ncbi:MAG TPA: hypothetical protein VJ553_00855 [Candidatus Paceibacterota bacterium]|nr:hypothetical protein [Candidatus Paceibacterota bacterium]
MSAGVTVTSKYGGKKIEALLRLTGANAVLVGVLRGTGVHPYAENGQTIAEIAWWNEFGTGRIPERPFLRWTLRENDYYRKHMMMALRASLLGKVDPIRGLKIVGAQAASDVRMMITNGDFVPNAEATIRKKSTSAGIKDKPLIDTGALRQSIQFELAGAEHTGGGI